MFISNKLKNNITTTLTELKRKCYVNDNNVVITNKTKVLKDKSVTKYVAPDGNLYYRHYSSEHNSYAISSTKPKFSKKKEHITISVKKTIPTDSAIQAILDYLKINIEFISSPPKEEKNEFVAKKRN
jgi:hypothetical protein